MVSTTAKPGTGVDEGDLKGVKKSQMKDKGQLLESIERFRNGFWAKKCTNRPPIGIVPDDIFTPIKYLREDFSRAEMQPADLDNDELCASDYEFAFVNRPIARDDFMPFSASWRAIPWLEAICGCPIRYPTGSLAPAACVNSLQELADIKLPANRQWLDCLANQTRRLLEHLPDDCWASPTILRGPSDMLAAMRGITDFCYDLVDDISIIDRAAAKVNTMLLDVLDTHFSIVPAKLGGFGHIYGYWAPDKTVVIQEDVLGMCSPVIYREVFMKYNTAIIKYLGDCVLFHVHSTGYRHYKDVLDIEGIAGLQLTVEANGPTLLDMLADLRYILGKSRLILFVDHYFEQLPAVLRKLPKEGLYLIISDKFVSSENDFREFMQTNW